MGRKQRANLAQSWKLEAQKTKSKRQLSALRIPSGKKIQLIADKRLKGERAEKD